MFTHVNIHVNVSSWVDAMTADRPLGSPRPGVAAPHPGVRMALTGRARGRRVLGSLDLPSRPRLADVHAAVERVTGSVVRVVDAETRQGLPHGLWLRFDDLDLIVIARTTSELHRRHIVLHEYAHLLLGHRGLSGTATALVPHLAPRTVARLMGRTVFDTAEERDAEQFAIDLGRLIATRGPQAEDHHPSVVSRLADVVG